MKKEVSSFVILIKYSYKRIMMLLAYELVQIQVEGVGNLDKGAELRIISSLLSILNTTKSTCRNAILFTSDLINRLLGNGDCVIDVFS